MNLPESLRNLDGLPGTPRCSCRFPKASTKGSENVAEVPRGSQRVQGLRLPDGLMHGLEVLLSEGFIGPPAGASKWLPGHQGRYHATLYRSMLSSSFLHGSERFMVLLDLRDASLYSIGGFMGLPSGTTRCSLALR